MKQLNVRNVRTSKAMVWYIRLDIRFAFAYSMNKGVEDMSHVTVSKTSKYQLAMTLIKSCKYTASQFNFQSYKIIFIRKGQAKLSLNGESLTLDNGNLILLNELDILDSIDFKGEVIDLLTFDPKIIHSKFTYDFVREHDREQTTNPEVMDLYWLNPFLKDDNVSEKIFKLDLEMVRRFKELYTRLDEQLFIQPDNFWVCRSRSYLIELLHLISSMAISPTMGETGAEKIVNCVVDYLHANYDQHITIDGLSKEFGMNRTSLNRHFIDEIDMPIKAYLIKYRLEVAAAMIRDTNISLNEIACRSGYKDMSHFRRSFKKQYHVTPSKYRESFIVEFG